MTPTTPGRPDPPVGHGLIDAYAEALGRGEAVDPEDWLRDRGRDDPPAVAALQTVGLLVRHRELLRARPGTPGRPDRSPPGFPSSALGGVAISDASGPVEARAPDLLGDADWLRRHGLDAVGLLDVDGGGMGKVALAWHSRMKRLVVLKVARGGHLVERFLREIEVHAKLAGHPNIAVSRSALSYKGEPVLVVDYIPGHNLRRRVRADGPLPWRLACDCVRQAALGLDHAHRQGVIHRDVKSSNLVRSGRDGVVSVIDWGLAFDRDDRGHGDDRPTESGQFLGTPDYCPPEQARDARAATAASDLYGLGCVWYELLTGSLPFLGDREALERLHASSPVPPLDPALGVPEAVGRVLRKLLDKDPRGRYPSASDFIADLDRAMNPPDVGRGRAPLKTLAAAAVLLTLLLAWRFWTPPARTAVLDLVIDLVDVGPNPERSATIGRSVFGAREGDQVSLRARLSEPAYAYVISFSPDGGMELCVPVDDSEPPERTASPSLPLDRAFGLNEGPGLQAYAVVSSLAPLPAFRAWRAGQGGPPWKKTAADPGVVLRFDGQDLVMIKPDATVRRPVADPGGARGAVAKLAAWLRSRPGVDAVFIKAFAVTPAR